MAMYEVVVFDRLCYLKLGSRIQHTFPLQSKAEYNFLKKLWLTSEGHTISYKRVKFVSQKEGLCTCDFKRYLVKKPKKKGLLQISTYMTMKFLSVVPMLLLIDMWRARGSRLHPREAINPYTYQMSLPDDVPF